MKWESVRRLRDLFPDAFPPSLRKGRLTAYMADNDSRDHQGVVKYASIEAFIAANPFNRDYKEML